MSQCGTGQYAEAVRSFQKAYWEALLRFTNWKVTTAADIAGMNRCHVYRHLRAIGVLPRQPK